MAFEPIGYIDPINGGFTGGDIGAPGANSPSGTGKIVRTKAADLRVTSPDNGITLDVTLIIIDTEDPNLPAIFNVYYLPPDSVSEYQVLNDFNSTKPYRQNVGQIPSAGGFASINVLVYPLYVAGGWMYAAAQTAPSLEPWQYTTFPVEVPVFGADTTAPNTAFSAATAVKTATATANLFRVRLTWTNPYPLFGSVRFMKLWMFNYFNDGIYREMGHFRCNTQVGQVQPASGLDFYLWTDSSAGVHNVTFYFGEANASRQTTFLPTIGAYTSATLVGGI